MECLWKLASLALASSSVAPNIGVKDTKNLRFWGSRPICAASALVFLILAASKAGLLELTKMHSACLAPKFAPALKVDQY